MLDVLVCYGLAANMIRTGYFSLVADIFQQAWASCRELGATYSRRTTAVMLRRPPRGENSVISTA